MTDFVLHHVSEIEAVHRSIAQSLAFAADCRTVLNRLPRSGERDNAVIRQSLADSIVMALGRVHDPREFGLSAKGSFPRLFQRLEERAVQRYLIDRAVDRAAARIAGHGDRPIGAVDRPGSVDCAIVRAERSYAARRLIGAWVRYRRSRRPGSAQRVWIAAVRRERNQRIAHALVIRQQDHPGDLDATLGNLLEWSIDLSDAIAGAINS